MAANAASRSFYLLEAPDTVDDPEDWAGALGFDDDTDSEGEYPDEMLCPLRSGHLDSEDCDWMIHILADPTIFPADWEFCTNFGIFPTTVADA